MAMHETELGEFAEMGEFQETGEMHEDEQFLGDLVGSLVRGAEVSPLTEAQEAELAAELLEISSEEELEQFLGSLLKKAGGFIKSNVGGALGGVLKNIAKKALPIVGGALGSMVAPGLGTALGSKLGSMASGLFEVELEAMPQEQAEFEVARRLVGLTVAAARNAASARPRRGVGPQTVARAAVARAARTYAPGVYRQMMHSLRTTARPGYRRQGRSQAAGYGPPVQGRGRRAEGRPYGPPAGPGYEPAYGQAPYWGGDDGMEPADEPMDWADPYQPPAGANGGTRTSGRWVRRGRKILLLEV